jgi:hypothetical protein
LFLLAFSSGAAEGGTIIKFRGTALLGSLSRRDTRHIRIVPTEHCHQFMLACARFCRTDGADFT